MKVIFSCAALCLMLGVMLSAPVLAHESRPAYLEISEQEPGSYALVWKVPRRGDDILPLQLLLPSTCEDLSPPARYLQPNAALTRRSVICGEAGMAHQDIAITGFSATISDALVRISLLSGETQTAILNTDRPRLRIAAPQNPTAVLGSYIRLGIEHILFGIDHLLFVLGLLLIVRGVGRLVKTITAFTLAHSVTLGLAALGFVRVPQAPVEAVIALSILFLATELVKQQRGDSSMTERYPWLVALTFGLLHGFGFAGALSEVGLPQTEIPLALFGFNIGVELGQLLFVSVSLAVIWLLQRLRINWPGWAEQLPAYGIGSLAAFWCIERVAAF